jgi:hypothetical protein
MAQAIANEVKKSLSQGGPSV